MTTQGTSRYRTYRTQVTSGALSWDIDPKDDFDLKRLTVSFDTAPAALENVILTLDSQHGTAYDCTLTTVDPNSVTSISIEGVCAIANGDKINVGYLNTGNHTVSVVATVEL
jgi:hypothetical protein